MTDTPIAVVGGGLAGLASACTLAARGHRVALYERNPWLGGKAARLEVGGYTFDMGPTILTVPSTLARVFAEAGRDVREALDLVPLDPQWRCFFADGSTLDLWADLERMREALEAFAPGRGLHRGYERFLASARRIHDVSKRFFFYRPVGGIGDMFQAGSLFDLSTLADVLSIRMDRTVYSHVRASVRDPRLAQMLDHFTQYVGSAPDASPAVLCGIAHMQTDEGVWYPRGGMRAIALALTDLAADLGVELHPGRGVRRIAVDGGRVRGLELEDGGRVAASAVVCNADVVRASRELLPPEQARRFAGRREPEPACSGVVLYLGLKERYEHLLHHDFVFSEDPEEEFEAIYRRGEPAADPTCYLAAPARTDPAVAPEGGEALYVLVHTPYLRDHHDWQAMLPGYRRVVLDKLARGAGLTDLEDRIAVEAALTPQDIHERYGVLRGAIYGLASHGRLTGAFKPSNVSDVEGLVFAGGAAHPGPGVPMVVMSGWIAADALDRQLGGEAAPSEVPPAEAPAQVGIAAS